MEKAQFNQEIEERIQALTLNPFIRQADLAILLDASAKSVKIELEEKGVRMTRFGYSTQQVIKALDLRGYLDTLKEFRA